MSAITYELEWTWCNKKACKRCPHGPYWYSYKSEFKGNGKRVRVVKSYVGKKLPLNLGYDPLPLYREQDIRNNRPKRKPRKQKKAK